MTPPAAESHAKHGLALGIAVVSSVALAVFVSTPNMSEPRRTYLLVLSLVAFCAVVLVPRLRSTLPLRGTVVLSVTLVLVAVVAPPNNTDFWYYQMYGRTVIHHQQNPYRHAPIEYEPDPVLARTGGFWDGVRPEYGPVLVGTATVIYAATGPSEIAGRLAWQGLAGAAVLVTIVLVMKRTHDAAAVALIGLNPLMIYSTVHAGHSDALIGLGVLAAVLLAERGRYVLSSLAVTLAMLIKAPLFVAVAALLVWMAWRNRVRALLAAAAAGILALVAVAVFGGPSVVLTPMLTARGRTSLTAAWNLVRENGLTPFTGHTASLGPVGDVVPLLAVAVAVLAAAFLILTWSQDADPASPVAPAIAAWLAVALYTSPWSGAWLLPVLALRSRVPTLSTRLVVVWLGVTLLALHSASATIASGWAFSPSYASYDTVLAYLIDIAIVRRDRCSSSRSIGEALLERSRLRRSVAAQPRKRDLLNTRTVDINASPRHVVGLLGPAPR